MTMDNYIAPDPAHAALIVIDMQNDFTLPDAPARIPGTLEIVPAARTVLDAFRQRGRPIFHIVRLYRGDGSNVDLCRRALIESGKAIVRPDTAGADIVGDLKPDAAATLDADALLAGEAQLLGDREWALYKPRWSAFYGTRLDALLEPLNVSTLVFIGCNFPNCPRSTIYDASSRDFRIVAVRDSISGLYGKGLEELRGIGVVTMPAASITDWLGA
jgi:nicotinamidase-related amidase